MERTAKRVPALVYPGLIRVICEHSRVPLTEFEMDLPVGAAIRLPDDNLETAFVFQPFRGMPQSEESSAPPPIPQHQPRNKKAPTQQRPATVPTTENLPDEPQPHIPTTSIVSPVRTIPPAPHSSQHTFATINQIEELSQAMTAGLETLTKQLEERDARQEEREARLEELRQKEVEDNQAFKKSISEAVQVMTKSQAETAKAQAETSQMLQSLLRILAGQSCNTPYFFLTV